ncbi:hypothetical protein CDAR_10511 [Caerostris darwini]|uniref:Uncharacterized protein n=1 Tax=Caerostris darwini TaxID=1538125 RepID=A0AAV4UXX4_9ARAC|nr:hypothetical protein CDAR_10511 [Caerostris darwini]
MKGNVSFYFPPFILSRKISSASTVPKTIPRASSDDSPRNRCPPYTQLGRGRMEGGCRSLICGDSRDFRPADKGFEDPNLVLSLPLEAPNKSAAKPLDPEENLGRAIVAYDYCCPLENSCSSAFVFGGRLMVRRWLVVVIFISVIRYFKVILRKSKAS